MINTLRASGYKLNESKQGDIDMNLTEKIDKYLNEMPEYWYVILSDTDNLSYKDNTYYYSEPFRFHHDALSFKVKMEKKFKQVRLMRDSEFEHIKNKWKRNFHPFDKKWSK